MLHTNVGSFDSTGALVRRARQSEVSAHYLVGLDGQVAQFVDEADTARHAGRVARSRAPRSRASEDAPTSTAIGIEFEDGGDPLGVARHGGASTATGACARCA